MTHMPRRNRNGRGSPGNKGHRPSRKEMRKQKRNLEKSLEEKGYPPEDVENARRLREIYNLKKALRLRSVGQNFNCD